MISPVVVIDSAAGFNEREGAVHQAYLLEFLSHCRVLAGRARFGGLEARFSYGSSPLPRPRLL